MYNSVSVYVCVTFGSPTSNAGLAGYIEKRLKSSGIKAAMAHVVNWTACDGYQIQKPQKHNLSGGKKIFYHIPS